MFYQRYLKNSEQSKISKTEVKFLLILKVQTNIIYYIIKFSIEFRRTTYNEFLYDNNRGQRGGVYMNIILNYRIGRTRRLFSR
jgi:hypothetical protein